MNKFIFLYVLMNLISGTAFSDEAVSTLQTDAEQRRAFTELLESTGLQDHFKELAPTDSFEERGWEVINHLVKADPATVAPAMVSRVILEVGLRPDTTNLTLTRTRELIR